MQQRKRFILLITIGLISLFAIRIILAQDNNGHGHGGGNGNNGSQVVQPTPTDNNGNHHGGGNGNGSSQNHNDKPAATAAPQQNTTQLGCQKNNPSRLDCSSL